LRICCILILILSVETLILFIWCLTLKTFKSITCTYDQTPIQKESRCGLCLLALAWKVVNPSSSTFEMFHDLFTTLRRAIDPLSFQNLTMSKMERNGYKTLKRFSAKRMKLVKVIKAPESLTILYHSNIRFSKMRIECTLFHGCLFHLKDLNKN